MEARLTDKELRLLKALADLGSPTYVTRLANVAGVSVSHAFSIINRLEVEGLVRTYVKNAFPRKRIAVITDYGRECLAKACLTLKA